MILVVSIFSFGHRSAQDSFGLGGSIFLHVPTGDLMRHLYQGYYQPTDADLNILRREGLIVFDANVLLNLYRYRLSTREKLFKEIEKNNDRVWIPYHVGLEFHRNRLKVIFEQNDKSPRFREIVDENISRIEGSVGNLNLKKKHSFLDPDGLITGLKKVRDEFFEGIEKEEGRHNPVQSGAADVVLDQVGKLFEGRIGNSPESQDLLNEIYKEGEKRYAAKIPPGYEDSRKGDENDNFHFGGLEYSRKFGDLIIWKQIIDYVKSKNIKNIIFVTEDEKKDWWWFAEWGKKELIGARPELVEEICREGGASRFYLCNTARFLKLVDDASNSDEIKEAIQDVETVAAKRLAHEAAKYYSQPALFSDNYRHNRSSSFGYMERGSRSEIYDIIARHISFRFGEIIPYDKKFPMFVSTKLEEKYGYTIVSMRTTRAAVMRVREILYRAYHALMEDDFSVISIYVCVLEGLGDYTNFRSELAYLQKSLNNVGSNIIVVVGEMVSDENEQGSSPEFAERIVLSSMTGNVFD